MSASSAADGAGGGGGDDASLLPPDDRLLRIDPRLVIPRAELVARASRSSGAGGQHVNKTSSRVEITWNVLRSPSLDEDQRARLVARLASRMNDAGELRVVASDTRSQFRNRELAEQRLAALVRAALVVPRKRKATRPTRAAKEARLQDKHRHAEKKRDRRRGFDDYRHLHVPKRFDERYFDRWYRDPAFRIGTTADLERLVRFAVAAAEYVLARPIRSVLDVGAGEGRWAPVLRRLRPRARYHGVDPSEYAVARYGHRRNIVRGTLDDLDALFGGRAFDLVICCSVLNYLPRAEMMRGIAALARHTGGLAYLEIYASSDDVMGDTAGWHSESAATYRRIARDAGLIPCGLSCYVPEALRDHLVALERAEP